MGKRKSYVRNRRLIPRWLNGLFITIDKMSSFIRNELLNLYELNVFVALHKFTVQIINKRYFRIFRHAFNLQKIPI